MECQSNTYENIRDSLSTNDTKNSSDFRSYKKNHVIVESTHWKSVISLQNGTRPNIID